MHRRTAGAVGVLVSVLVAALSPAGASAVARTAYDTNLLRNARAERPLDAGGLIRHWSPSGVVGFQEVAYGAPGGFPTAAEGQRIGGGHRFFAGGPLGQDRPTIQQAVGINQRGGDIDTGHVEIHLSAWMATFGLDTDTATVLVSAADHLGAGISHATMTTTRTNGRFVHQAVQLHRRQAHGSSSSTWTPARRRAATATATSTTSR